MARNPLCVEWQNGNSGPKGWCILKPGEQLDPTATVDSTACGSFVMMRIGSKRRQPTCQGCIEALAPKAEEADAS